MKQLIITTVLAMGFATWSPAELIENGDFSNGVAHWLVSISQGYGEPDPSVDLVEGALEATRLHSSDPGYFNIAQAVNIQKGKRYKLSYEVKGEGEGTYIVSVQEVGKGRHHVNRGELPGSSWTPVEAEFEGSYDTDEKWLKKWHSATKKNELLDSGRTTRSDKLKKIDQPKRADPPTRSTLYFSIGGLKGSFAVRNVSIVEVK